MQSEGKSVTAIAYLSEGSQLRIKHFQGARINWFDYGNSKNYWGTLYGSKASMLYLDNTPLIGAGGGTDKIKIDNYYFSAADDARQSASRSGSYYNFESPAETLDGCHSATEFASWKYQTRYSDGKTIEIEANGSKYYNVYDVVAASGTNYLDTSRATLVEQKASNSPLSFRVEAIPNSQDDSYDAQISMANSLKQLVTTNKQIAEAIKDSSAGGNDMYPSVTVCENQNFDVVVAAYDDMQGGTSLNGECTVVNSTVGDGVIQLQGKFTTKGTYSVLINGNKFIVKVIEAPKPNTVKVILN